MKAYVDIACELRDCSKDKRYSEYIRGLLKTGSQALIDCNVERKRLESELKELRCSLQIIKRFMEVHDDDNGR